MTGRVVKFPGAAVRPIPAPPKGKAQTRISQRERDVLRNFDALSEADKCRAQRLLLRMVNGARIPAEYQDDALPCDIALDPMFRVWCAEQDQRARELGLPLPRYTDLLARYART